MPRIQVVVSELVLLRLKAHAEFEAGTSLSRAAADILADFLAEDDEIVDSQDAAWGGYRERIDDGDSGAAHEQLIGCSACGWMLYDMPENNVCPRCDVGGTLTEMTRDDAMAIKLREAKRALGHTD